jgi:hypothetical protein
MLCRQTATRKMSGAGKIGQDPHPSAGGDMGGWQSSGSRTISISVVSLPERKPLEDFLLEPEQFQICPRILNPS